MRATVDLRYNAAFPPIVPAGGAVVRDGVIYQGCGSPEAICTTDAKPTAISEFIDRYRGLGSTTTAERWSEFWGTPAGSTIRIVTSVLGAVHGYRRNGNSVPMAVVWFIGGAFFAPVAAAVMGVQTARYGFGKAPRGGR